MKIEHFIKQDYTITSPYSGIDNVKDELLNQNAVVVKEDTNYVGTLTATDILHKPHNLVIDCITEKHNLHADTTVCNALKIMKKLKSEVLPVYKEDLFIGLVYKNDLVEYLTDFNNELHQKLDEKTEKLRELNENLEQLVEIKTKKLNDLVNTKNKFFSIIAHDLRSPFNTILGFSDLLRKNADKYDKQKIKDLALTINKISHQTYKLLDNLLEWSRIQQNSLPFKPISIDLREFADEKISNLKRHADEKNINLINNITEEIIVCVDLNMFKSIFRNLIYNSIKYTESGGIISVNSIVLDKKVKITIKDTGIGMSEEQKQMIFNSKYQESKLGTQGENGTGLGLLLFKEFVDYHKGEIDIVSEIGKGSSFSFTIPMNN